MKALVSWLGSIGKRYACAFSEPMRLEVDVVTHASICVFKYGEVFQ